MSTYNQSNLLKHIIEQNTSALEDFYVSQQKILQQLSMSVNDNLLVTKAIVNHNKQAFENFLTTNLSILNDEQPLKIDSELKNASLNILDDGCGNVALEPTEKITDNDLNNNLEQWLVERIAKMIGLLPKYVSVHADLQNELGLDSLRMLDLWAQFIHDFPDYEKYRDCLYDSNNIADFVRHIEEKESQEGEAKGNENGYSWIVTEIADMLGLPVGLIEKDAHLEDDLGFDSIRVVELQHKINERYPALENKPIDLYSIAYVKDVERILNEIDANLEKEAALHPFSVALKAELEVVNGAPINETDGFYENSQLNAFLVESALNNTFKEYHKLSQYSNALMNCGSLKEIDSLISRLPHHLFTEDVNSDNEAVQRLIWRQGVQKVDLKSTDHKGRCILFLATDGVKDWEHLGNEQDLISIVELEKESWCVQGKKYAAANDAEIRELFTDLNLGSNDNLVFVANKKVEEYNSSMLQPGWEFLKYMRRIASMSFLNRNDIGFTLLVEQSSILWQVAARGVAKAIYKEWPHTNIKTINFYDKPSSWKAAELLNILCHAPSRNDLVLKNGQLYQSELVNDPDQEGAGTAFPLSVEPHEVILLLGGASGITAEITKALAGRYACHFVCVGRTEKPKEEPFSGIHVDALTIQDIMDSESESRSPKELQKQLTLIKRQKSIFRTQYKVEKNGGTFHYFNADSAQATDIYSLIDKCQEIGPIAGIVHGSGFAIDTVIERKSKKEFKGVFETKAMAAWHLYEKLKNTDTLKFVFFMSSLSSVYGTQGQADYVSANDFLNELAAIWNKEASYMVKSLIWGVWSETGFVKDNSSILKVLQNSGMQGIRNDQGAEALCNELKNNGEDTSIVFTTSSCLDHVRQR